MKKYVIGLVILFNTSMVFSVPLQPFNLTSNIDTTLVKIKHSESKIKQVNWIKDKIKNTERNLKYSQENVDDYKEEILILKELLKKIEEK